MPVLLELHWLLVWSRVNFKMATLVYLSLSGMAPAYLVPTVSWSPPHQGRVLADGATATMETGVLQLQV